ncbi:GIY-YIG nuclease family protein [Ensifer canadensis]|uniref:GIY-YIG nuclease family protein n=1 Tax=Ensifer canadensis TaxID=555315 RepID=UPI0035E3E37D
MTYYVYELVDPITDSVFYVGKGQKARIDAHEAEANRGVASAKCDRIRDIWSLGLSVTKRKVASFADEQEAFDFEADLICGYGLESLTNITPGGGGVRGAPTIYQDRISVRVAAEGINRTRNGEIKGVLVNGYYLDLLEFIDQSKRRAFEVIDRRGTEWANRIAKRFGVVFSYG